MKAADVGAVLFAGVLLCILEEKVHIDPHKDPSTVILSIEVLVMGFIIVAFMWEHLTSFLKRSDEHSHSSAKTMAGVVSLAFVVSVGLYLTAVFILRTPAPHTPGLQHPASDPE
jgi:hypothetical protein